MLSRSAVAAGRQRARALHASSRSFASAAEASSSTSAAVSSEASASKAVSAGIILNRSPILTRTPSTFESAYYAYQSRIRRALFNPFPSEFYFKQGSLLEGKFMREEKTREREAFGRPWLFLKKRSDGLDEYGNPVDPTVGQTDSIGEEILQPPAPRIHESDKTGDVKNLNRQGERNLYLLVRGKDVTGKDVWRFPQGGLEEGELLHQAAERDLFAECGEHMDTWIVGKKPIAVYQPSVPENTKKTLGAEPYTFFLKAHILAGQVRPNGKTATDFAWLTKEEIEPRVEKAYWESVKDTLADY